MNKLNKVLLVDDSSSMRAVLGTLLTNEGYEIVGSLPSGDRLLNAVAALKPDIVCLDYNLPGRDGLDLLQELRDSFPEVAVVMITGELEPSLYNRAVDIGTAGFLRKPFKPLEIAGLMSQVSHALRLLKDPIKSSGTIGSNSPSAVIADDSLTIRQLLVAILKEAHVNVVGEANNGQEAVDLVEKHSPDLVCLDVEMPVMTGFQALEKIRASWPQTRVLMVTGKAGKDDVMQAVAKGAAGYIVKPFHPDKVVSQIAALFARKKLQRPAE